MPEPDLGETVPGTEAVLARDDDDVPGQNRRALQVESELIADMDLVAERDRAVVQAQLDQRVGPGSGPGSGTYVAPVAT